MPTGVYERTEKHKKTNSDGHKRHFKNNIKARRKLSASVMKTNHFKKLRGKNAD